MKNKLFSILISIIFALYFTSSIVYLMPDTNVDYKRLSIFIFAISMLLLYIRFRIFEKKILPSNWLLVITFFIYFFIIYFALISGVFSNDSLLIDDATLFYELLIITIIPLVLILWYLEIQLFNLNYRSIVITDNENAKSEKLEVKIVSDSKKSELNLELNNLILVEAQDNYCKIFFESQEGTIQKTLFRMSLKKMNDQILDLDNIHRCHRSYLVNKNKILDIAGRSQNYKIHLKGIDKSIPVSRNFDIELLK